MKRFVLPFTVAITLAGVIAWQLLFVQTVNYYIVSVATLLLSMLPFFVSFEVKNMSAAEITLTATFIAIAVASRAAFYLLEQVKPIAAVVVVAAVCLGAERGYIVGAFSAFISNFIFSQGYWTPFQMVGLGMVGLTAGFVFRAIKINRWSLAIVGFVLAFALYGAIVDVSTILMVCGNDITLPGVLAVYASGAPFSAVFGASTAAFLFVFGVPFINKTRRIIDKYGILKAVPDA